MELQYTALPAAAFHDGSKPDLLDEVTWWQAGALATRRHNDQSGNQRKRSSDGAAAEHNGGTASVIQALATYPNELQSSWRPGWHAYLFITAPGLERPHLPPTGSSWTSRSRHLRP
jgi:hypothetical protein